MLADPDLLWNIWELYFHTWRERDVNLLVWLIVSVWPSQSSTQVRNYRLVRLKSSSSHTSRFIENSQTRHAAIDSIYSTQLLVRKIHHLLNCPNNYFGSGMQRAVAVVRMRSVSIVGMLVILTDYTVEV